MAAASLAAQRKICFGCPLGAVVVTVLSAKTTHLLASTCINRAIYSNRGWREKIFENMFFEAERRGKLFQMKVLGAAIDSDKFSSKSELSSRFFGRLKFFVLFEYLGL